MQKSIRYKGKERRVHIHLCLGREFWNSFLIFRDYLRKNKKDREEYSRIKRKGLNIAKGNGKIYRDYKEKFIQDLIKKALDARNIEK